MMSPRVKQLVVIGAMLLALPVVALARKRRSPASSPIRPAACCRASRSRRYTSHGEYLHWV